MTDIERRAFKVTLIRAVTIAMSLVVCTWKLSAVFSEFSAKMDKIDAFIQSHEGKDAVKDSQILQLQTNRVRDRHDLDSIGRVLNAVSLRVMPAEFFTQKRVNGRLMMVPAVNNHPM